MQLNVINVIKFVIKVKVRFLICKEDSQQMEHVQK